MVKIKDYEQVYNVIPSLLPDINDLAFYIPAHISPGSEASAN
jgi:hypothetical protein